MLGYILAIGFVLRFGSVMLGNLRFWASNYA